MKHPGPCTCAPQMQVHADAYVDLNIHTHAYTYAYVRDLLNFDNIIAIAHHVHMYIDT